mgnify:FL=1
MNIHFTDEKLFKELMCASIARIDIGSHMYGLNTVTSDRDVLVIYADSYCDNMLFRTHHQLQYKRDNTDYIFTSVTQFFHNLMSGDSTINYEALLYMVRTGKYKELDALVPLFSNVNVITSYLGMAKRDIKFYKKDKSNKKVYHIVRGIEFAKALCEKKDIFKELDDIRPMLNLIRGIDADYDKLVDDYTDFMNKTRESIRDELFSLTSDEHYMIEDAVINLLIEFDDKRIRRFSFGHIVSDAIREDKFGY